MIQLAILSAINFFPFVIFEVDILQICVLLFTFIHELKPLGMTKVLEFRLFDVESLKELSISFFNWTFHCYISTFFNRTIQILNLLILVPEIGFDVLNFSN